MSEEREFRVYIESMGDTPLLTGIMGEDALERLLVPVRENHPNEYVFVREVLERVVRVSAPDGTEHTFDGKRKAMTHEDDTTRQLRQSQPIHCIEEVPVLGGFQARYLLPGETNPVILPRRSTYREAVLDVPNLYGSASLDRDLFDAEVARRHNLNR